MFQLLKSARFLFCLRSQELPQSMPLCGAMIDQYRLCPRCTLKCSISLLCTLGYIWTSLMVRFKHIFLRLQGLTEHFALNNFTATYGSATFKSEVSLHYFGHLSPVCNVMWVNGALLKCDPLCHAKWECIYHLLKTADLIENATLKATRLSAGLANWEGESTCACVSTISLSSYHSKLYVFSS